MTLRWWIADSLEMVKRNLRHIRRTPELLLDVTLQPIMFVILFRFVFGGAIPIEGTTYVNYLMAGIFVQTVAFAGVSKYPARIKCALLGWMAWKDATARALSGIESAEVIASTGTSTSEPPPARHVETAHE